MSLRTRLPRPALQAGRQQHSEIPGCVARPSVRVHTEQSTRNITPHNSSAHTRLHTTWATRIRPHMHHESSLSSALSQHYRLEPHQRQHQTVASCIASIAEGATHLRLRAPVRASTFIRTGCGALLCLARLWECGGCSYEVASAGRAPASSARQLAHTERSWNCSRLRPFPQNTH